MSNAHEIKRDYSGAAALSICESLLLALSEGKVLSDHEVQGLLEDAAIIERMRAGRHLLQN